MCYVKYNIASEHGMDYFRKKQFRELPDPIPSISETVPDPDSIPLSILNYPLQKGHEIDLAAYDPPELTLPLPAEEIHPVSVFCLDYLHKV
jgi:hypothetical protein